MKKIMAIAFMAAAAFGLAAAEKLVYTAPFAKNADFSGWGSPKFYQKYQFSAANGVGKLVIVKAVEKNKSSIQPVVTCKYTFKKGVTYKFTGTLKANRNMSGSMNFQLTGAPYTTFKGVPFKLVKDTPYNYSFECTPKADITAPTRVPGLHVPMLTGDVLEISSVKVFEVTK